jgi:hypothetical protein
MARVVLRRTSSGTAPLPSVCVKTGVPTANVVRIRGRSTPGWTASLILFSWIGWLIATSATSRNYEVLLPYSASVFKRWGRQRQLAIGLGLLALFITVIAAVDNTWFLIPALATVATAVVCGVANELANACGMHVNRNGDLVLSRVHPAFKAAVATQQQFATYR